MINQIIQVKLEKYFESRSVGHGISPTLSFFDVINLLATVKNQKLISKNFNKNWLLLHGELFEEIFEDAKKSMNKDISKKDFNKIFKTIYESDQRVKTCKSNINNIIQKSQPILHSTLNVKPKTKIVTGDISGDIGISKKDL